GCNYLVKNNKAALICTADDLLAFMNWQEKEKPASKKQRELFIELTADEKNIVALLQKQESLQIDELYFKSGMSSSALAAALLSLEMQSVVIALPGKIYKLC
ncbi:MAG TPA: DNA-protecting protein DprA, partial [Ferruginibacter sp.]|nr:DNA-protecting protein DprA [Ferruginibacter sp.]